MLKTCTKFLVTFLEFLMFHEKLSCMNECIMQNLPSGLIRVVTAIIAKLCGIALILMKKFSYCFLSVFHIQSLGCVSSLTNFAVFRLYSQKIELLL